MLDKTSGGRSLHSSDERRHRANRMNHSMRFVCGDASSDDTTCEGLTKYKIVQQGTMSISIGSFPWRRASRLLGDGQVTQRVCQGKLRKIEGSYVEQSHSSVNDFSGH
jgi:hypothetical protein